MDKGIRPFCNAKFVELLPTRVNTREGNIRFRKEVRHAVMEAFGCTGASASTHYNHAFIEARKNPDLAELLVGLGRPEDKKGGRKPKAKTEATPAPAVEPVANAETPAAPAAEAGATAGPLWPFAPGYTGPQQSEEKPKKSKGKKAKTKAAVVVPVETPEQTAPVETATEQQSAETPAA